MLVIYFKKSRLIYGNFFIKKNKIYRKTADALDFEPHDSKKKH